MKETRGLGWPERYARGVVREAGRGVGWPVPRETKLEVSGMSLAVNGAQVRTPARQIPAPQAAVRRGAAVPRGAVTQAAKPPAPVREPPDVAGIAPAAGRRVVRSAREQDPRGSRKGREWPRPTSCRVITIANQKGGVGKTTTAVNLAAGLALNGARVLVIDLDPQGNASTALNVNHHAGVPSIYNVLVDDMPLASIVQRAEELGGLSCAPATIDLAGAEIELVPMVARETRLARALAAYDRSDLDYVFVDCPPSLGLLTVNALVAAAEVLIPIQCEYYALEGLEQLLRSVELVRDHLNAGLSVSTILLTMYDARTRLAAQVAEDVRAHFGNVVLGAVIPRSVRVSEAPSYGQSVLSYDPASSGALAYLEAAKEVALRNLGAGSAEQGAEGGPTARFLA